MKWATIALIITLMTLTLAGLALSVINAMS